MRAYHFYNSRESETGCPTRRFYAWGFSMPKGLKRYYGRDDLHFITFCCYQRRPMLRTARVRNIALKILQQVRAR